MNKNNVGYSVASQVGADRKGGMVVFVLGAFRGVPCARDVSVCTAYSNITDFGVITDGELFFPCNGSLNT